MQRQLNLLIYNVNKFDKYTDLHYFDCNNLIVFGTENNNQIIYNAKKILIHDDLHQLYLNKKLDFNNKNNFYYFIASNNKKYKLYFNGEIVHDSDDYFIPTNTSNYNQNFPAIKK